MIEPKIVQKDQASSHLTFLFIYCFFVIVVYCQISYPIKDLHDSDSNIPV